MAEVDKIRPFVIPFLNGDGLDLGFGGCPVNANSICVDIEDHPYWGSTARHLTGDARKLRWFKDGVLDYVFSSHLLEDFDDTKTILSEWMRVLKPRGIIALYLPDQDKYEKVIQLGCNILHRTRMNLPYMKGVFSDLGIELIYEYEEELPYMYGFLIVGKKKEDA